MKELDIKNFIEPLKLLSQWMTGGESWLTPCTNMCPYVPACANIAVCQLCRERQPLVEQSWWAWTENAWINAVVLVSMAQALPKAGAKWLYSPNLIHEFTSLFSQNVIYAGLFGKAFPRKHTFVDISVFLWLGGTVMIHDGLNLTCLDQGHGVRSHGKSSSQSCCRRIIIRQSEFDPWVYILVSPKMIYGGWPRKAFSRKQAFVDINAFLWLRKQQWNSHDSWWPELNMFGSRPWCSFPWQKLVSKLVQKNCCINLIDEFTSLFSPKLVFAGLLRHAFVDAS